jgi:hypothetical protein
MVASGKKTGVSVIRGVELGFKVLVGLGSGVGVGVQVGGRMLRTVGVLVGITAKAGIVAGGKGFILACGLM